MNKANKKPDYRQIPSVSKILMAKSITDYKKRIRPLILKRIIGLKLEQVRQEASTSGKVPEEVEIIQGIKDHLSRMMNSSLRQVINATGVILHTNLGRAPFGEEILAEITPVLQGYNNLEFNLQTAQRGSRNSHLEDILKLVLNCESSVVVNNNAAALMLTLKTLAEGKEVIISRGELVEIGGSFRIPEIIEASGAKLIEVGTTNKTKLGDYERAITDQTALFLKVHKSNYYMHGFTEEVSLKDLSRSAKKHKINLVFDLGTGLLDRTLYKGMENEPDVCSALEDGADVVTFSCDKLLGGPQAGIATGRSELIRPISKHPLMRALRVDKLTISVLNRVLIGMMSNKTLLEEHNRVIRYINRDLDQITELAQILADKLKNRYLEAIIIDNQAQCGGGTLPYHCIESKAVLIKPKNIPADIKKSFAETLYHKLLESDIPVLGVLREGNLLFDTLTLELRDIDLIANSVKKILPYWK